MFDVVDQAMYDLVHCFRGGSTRLAPLVNMNAGTLSNKVNPSMETHHLSVKESLAIQNTTRRFDILHAEAMTLNHSCLPLVDYSGLSDMELLTAYAHYHKEIGETAAEVVDILSSGRVKREEVAKVKKELYEDFQAGLAFLARLEALIDE